MSYLTCEPPPSPRHCARCPGQNLDDSDIPPRWLVTLLDRLAIAVQSAEAVARTQRLYELVSRLWVFDSLLRAMFPRLTERLAWAAEPSPIVPRRLVAAPAHTCFSRVSC